MLQLVIKDGHDVFSLVGREDNILYVLDIEGVFAAVLLNGVYCVADAQEDQINFLAVEES